MGPTRAHKTTSDSSSHAKKGNPSKIKGHHHPAKESVLPGVQKVKSALRQTRRLLAKDNLAADVRVETERRQRALEADLRQAEQAKKERALSVRYHKVKFFERQKVVRKIKQTKQCLSTASKSDKSKLEKELRDLRVDLNYVLHYPKTQKYISLFPPEVRHSQSTPQISEAEGSHTNAARQDIRNRIQEAMESGELPTEPELHLDGRKRNTQPLSHRHDVGGSKQSFGKATEKVTTARKSAKDDFFEDEAEADSENVEEDGAQDDEDSESDFSE